MQFRAARSRCTIFLLARYSIPLPIWMHMSARRLSATVTFLMKVEENKHEKTLSTLQESIPLIVWQLNMFSQFVLIIRYVLLYCEVKILHVAFAVTK